MKALITGSGGLIGSECVRALCREGWDVVGIDNDMRAQFFGSQGTTRLVVEELIATLPPPSCAGLRSYDNGRSAVSRNVTGDDAT